MVALLEFYEISKIFYLTSSKIFYIIHVNQNMGNE